MPDLSSEVPTSPEVLSHVVGARMTSVYLNHKNQVESRGTHSLLGSFG